MSGLKSKEKNSFTDFILSLPTDKKQLFLYQFGAYSIIFGLYLLFLAFTGNELEVVADQIMFVRRGELILDGEIPFITAISGQSAPLSYYLWVFPLYLSKIFKFSHSVSFRLTFIIANIVTSFLIYSIVSSLSSNNHVSKKNDPQELSSTSTLSIPSKLSPFTAALIYSLNPFTIDLAIFWGSDETIAALLIVLPCWLLRKKMPFLAIVVIALGAGIKYFPVVLCAIFVFNDRPRNFIFRVLLSFFAFGAVFAVYFPFYYWGNTERLDDQFNRSTLEGGNQGVLTMLARVEWYDMDQSHVYFRWGLILFLCSAIGLIMLKKGVDDPFISAGPFLLVALAAYSKYQFSYLLMVNVFIVPFFLLSWKNITAYLSVFLTMGLFSLVFEFFRDDFVLLFISILHAISLLYWVHYLMTYGENLAKNKKKERLSNVIS